MISISGKITYIHEIEELRDQIGHMALLIFLSTQRE